ncbi:MAG: biotin--[acetyl-CoA-carboxylase] ligase [Candidatus Thermoplasmatota archaeon]|nr:biotin--[acetyl-CoA-carboxylase] ligase [Candidatus Thermoplasmatota archaeon]
MKKSSYIKKTEAFFEHLAQDVVKKSFVFDEVGSTNIKAKELAKAGAEEGTVVIAKRQSQGRGRFERNWESPEGGVYLSVILRPSESFEKLPLLSFVAALAVTKTIRSYGLPATIKWPNDVRVNGRKIAGILLESEGDGRSITYVIVGVGINLSVDLTKFSAPIQNKSTSVVNELHYQVDYHEFLKIFFLSFQHYYELMKAQRYGTIIDEWKASSDTLGKRVRIQTMTETLQGIAFDVDQSGFLLLRTEDAEIKKMVSGDCLYFDELDHT